MDEKQLNAELTKIVDASDEKEQALFYLIYLINKTIGMDRKSLTNIAVAEITAQYILESPDFINTIKKSNCLLTEDEAIEYAKSNGYMTLKEALKTDEAHRHFDVLTPVESKEFIKNFLHPKPNPARDKMLDRLKKTHWTEVEEGRWEVPSNDCFSILRNELYCKHNVGHSFNVHGCCEGNCCSKPGFREAFNREREKKAKVFFGTKYDPSLAHKYDWPVQMPDITARRPGETEEGRKRRVNNYRNGRVE